MDKSATWTVATGTLATSATSATVVGLYSAIAGRRAPGIIAAAVALNSGFTAITFFGLREYVVSPALTYSLPWPQYAHRRAELGIAGSGEPAISDTYFGLDNLWKNKLLDTAISGGITGGLIRGLRSGKRAILPGAAMASIACVALQYGYNQITVSRLRYLALPRSEELQPTFRQRMMQILGVTQISEDEYLGKLKRTRVIYEKRIKDLEKLALLEEQNSKK